MTSTLTQPFTVVDVVPDTDEWLEERRSSLGASEVPAVLGLSKWSTPLEVYRSKHGIDRDFDPELSFIGHAEEAVMAGWLERFHPELGKVSPGFMARSTRAPWLHASFDRMVGEDMTPVQMKTANHFAMNEWEDGVPLWVQGQVQTEIFVHGGPGEWVVGFVGGRSFFLRWVDRDDEFIEDYLLPHTKAFWDDTTAGRAPDPFNVHELAELYPSKAGTALEGSAAVLEASDRRAVLLSDIKALKEEADALQLAIGKYMGSAETLTRDGSPVLTYKTQRRAEYVVKETEFKVMKYVKGTK